LNILHVIRDLSRSTGGPVNALVGLAEAQAALGHHVMILASDAGDDKMVPQGVIVHLMPVRGGGWSWSPAIGRKLAGLMPGIDIVHGHMVWDYPVWAAARQARRHGKPFILRPCGHLDAWSLSQKHLKKKVYLAVMGSVVRTAAAIHFTSDGERNESLAAIGNRETLVIPLGVPHEAYTDLPSPDAFTARFPTLRSKRIVLFLGRLHPKKQPEVAIDAFHRVAALDERLHLVLVGPSEAGYQAMLAARSARLGLADRVTFTGLLHGEGVREAYSAAQVFVLPSFQENFGIAIIEAMAASCPVVISDRIDLANDIAAADAGIACAPDPIAMAAGLQTVIADDALRRRMGENGHALVLRRFTWPPVAAAVVDAYEKMIAAGALRQFTRAAA
jgi:glycosyltransferase involved in cell wall biosynthesis